MRCVSPVRCSQIILQSVHPQMFLVFMSIFTNMGYLALLMLIGPMVRSSKRACNLSIMAVLAPIGLWFLGSAMRIACLHDMMTLIAPDFRICAP